MAIAGETGWKNYQLLTKRTISFVQGLHLFPNLDDNETMYCTCEHYLGMIGAGKSNVRTVVSIAQSQLRDGPVPPAIECFASLGSYGAHPSNEERDLHRWLQGLHNITLSVYYTTMRIEASEQKQNILYQQFVSSRFLDIT